MKNVTAKKRRKPMTTIGLLLMVMFLYLSATIGVTWALFTSKGKDGLIGVNVTSGQVEVDIVDETGESVIGDALYFTSVDGRRAVLFEPGATYYTQGFQVKNTGTIPVNYRMNVSADSDEDMKEFEKAFEIYVTTDPTGGENAEKITEFQGRLKVGECGPTHYLVVKMKETANEKYQGKEYTGIGVTVYAIQGNVEIS